MPNKLASRLPQGKQTPVKTFVKGLFFTKKRFSFFVKNLKRRFCRFKPFTSVLGVTGYKSTTETFKTIVGAFKTILGGKYGRART